MASVLVEKNSGGSASPTGTESASLDHSADPVASEASLLLQASLQRSVWQSPGLSTRGLRCAVSAAEGKEREGLSQRRVKGTT